MAGLSDYTIAMTLHPHLEHDLELLRTVQWIYIH